MPKYSKKYENLAQEGIHFLVRSTNLNQKSDEIRPNFSQGRVFEISGGDFFGFLKIGQNIPEKHQKIY